MLKTAGVVDRIGSFQVCVERALYRPQRIDIRDRVGNQGVERVEDRIANDDILLSDAVEPQRVFVDAAGKPIEKDSAARSHCRLAVFRGRRSEEHTSELQSLA